MPHPRWVIAAVIAAVAVVTVGVGWWIGTQIGHKRAEDRAKSAAERPRPTADAEGRREREEERREQREERREQELEALDDAIDDANRDLLRAAKAGRRAAVDRAEARLIRATRERGAAGSRVPRPAKDPYAREVERFPVKAPPLFAQQISSSESDHVLFVGVSRAYFCLMGPSDRVRRVRESYGPVEHRLRSAGVNDFEMIVTPLTGQAPTRSAALAIGAGGHVSLTGRGAAC